MENGLKLHPVYNFQIQNIGIFAYTEEGELSYEIIIINICKIKARADKLLFHIALFCYSLSDKSLNSWNMYTETFMIHKHTKIEKRKIDGVML